MQQCVARLTAVLLTLTLAATAHAGGWQATLATFVFGSPDGEARAAGGLDPVADRCLSCHDGSAAHGIRVRRAGEPRRVSGFRTLEHPVGMRYDRYALTDPRHYRSRAALPAAVRFPEGRVSCPSCHAVEERIDGRLVRRPNGCLATGHLTVEPPRGDLCRSCHLM
ncbi:MAG: hypothetical protein D6739_03415 [Nitrospirae bacterium]|nr:MAG: hypothetical protein D6739_03415 [Nitrospirota bacterium]